MILFEMMGRIAEEMNASIGAFNFSNTTPTVLDFCVAPGGFVKYALQINPGVKVDALTLPEQQGGLKLRIPYEHWDPRVSMEYTDVTMFAEEFGLPDIVKDPETGTNLALSWPYKIDRYDLVLCDGQAIRQNQVEGDYFTPLRLTYSQLYIGLKRVAPGGTMIILLHRSSRVRIFRLIRMFRQFSDVQIFKPAKSHAIKSSFYLVAKKIQSESASCLEAMSLFKTVWERATLKTESPSSALLYRDFALIEKSLQPELEEFGNEFIKLVRHTWKIQADALEKAPFIKDIAAPRPICKHYLKGRCAYGKLFFKSHDAPG